MRTSQMYQVMLRPNKKNLPECNTGDENGGMYNGIWCVQCKQHSLSESLCTPHVDPCWPMLMHGTIYGSDGYYTTDGLMRVIFFVNEQVHIFLLWILFMNFDIPCFPLSGVTEPAKKSIQEHSYSCSELWNKLLTADQFLIIHVSYRDYFD